MSRRTERVGEFLRKEISLMVSQQLKDPRVAGVVTITKVDISVDLRHARVFVSVLGDEETKQSVMSGLTSAAGFMRRQLGDRLDLKYTPELSFLIDDTMEKADTVLRLMNRLAQEMK